MTAAPTCACQQKSSPPDLSRECALFAMTPEVAQGGKDSASAPIVVPWRLYELSLVPQEQAIFAAGPLKIKPVDRPFAGLARLRPTTSGDYRVCLDLPLRFDAISEGQIVAAKDFWGLPVQAPKKIVLYSFVAGQDLILQFSGAIASRLTLAITSGDRA